MQPLKKPVLPVRTVNRRVGSPFFVIRYRFTSSLLQVSGHRYAELVVPQFYYVASGHFNTVAESNRICLRNLPTGRQATSSEEPVQQKEFCIEKPDRCVKPEDFSVKPEDNSIELDGHSVKPEGHSIEPDSYSIKENSGSL